MEVQQNGATSSGKRRPWTAFHIVQREGMQKKIWQKIGVAWPNHDGSFNIVLDSMPVGGKVHIREEKERPPEDQQKGELEASIERVE